MAGSAGIRLRSWLPGSFLADLIWIIPLLLFALATLPALVILLYFKSHLWPNMLKICYVIGMTILFVSTVGTFFSSLFSRTATATAWTYALVIGLGLLTLLVLLGQELFSQRFIRTVFVLNPVIAAMDAAGHPTFQKYGLVFNHLKVFGAATAVMFVLTVIRVYRLRQAE